MNMKIDKACQLSESVQAVAGLCLAIHTAAHTGNFSDITKILDSTTDILDLLDKAPNIEEKFKNLLQDTADDLFRQREFEIPYRFRTLLRQEIMKIDVKELCLQLNHSEEIFKRAILQAEEKTNDIDLNTISGKALAEHMKAYAEFTVCNDHELLDFISFVNQKITQEQINQCLALFTEALKSREAPERQWQYFVPVTGNDYADYVKDTRDEVLKALDSTESYLFLYGEHGIGKTTLAKLCISKSEKYHSHTLFTEYNGSFRSTIETLYPMLYGKEYVRENPENAYLKVMQELNKNQRKTKEWLLVIDNFNNDTADENEEKYIQEYQSREFRELCDTGIRILITTTISRSFTDYGLEVIPLKETDLERLYQNRSNCSVTENARNVMDAVKKNTLIVTLIAGIVRNNIRESEKILERILRELTSLNVENEKSKVFDQGQRVPGRNTIFSHMKAVFHVANIKSLKWEVLENAILLPSAGTEKNFFLNMLAATEEERAKAEDAIQLLIDESWICEEEHENHTQWLSVHPIIREIVYKNDRFCYKDCSTYCESIFHKAKMDAEKIFLFV